MTLAEKIKTGLIVRSTVETRLVKFKSELDHHKTQYESMTGFIRDSYVSQNGIMTLNCDIDMGTKILKLMDELEVI